MRDEENAPRVCLEIVDEVKLPGTSVSELTIVLDQWEVKGKPPLDLKAAVATGELDDDLLVIVEIVSEGAVPEDLRAAFRSAELEPGNLLDAVRLLVQHESCGVPPFPFVCLGDVVTTSTASAPLLERGLGKTLIATNIDLQDDERHPRSGWTDHCFAPARRCAPSPKTIPKYRQEP